jgi:AraC-like DNA-binding protein
VDYELLRRQPSAGLAGIVHGYAGYSGTGAVPARRHEPAQASVVLIVNFGPTMRISGPRLAPVDADSFIAPLLDTHAVTETGTESHGLQVDMSPLGAHMLLGTSMRELSQTVVPLEDVLGPVAGLLAERLFELPDWRTRFELVEAFVGARVEEARRPSPDVARAWWRLSETGGRLPIGKLAAELGCSGRHLAARFREQIGPSPKAAARILRFRGAVDSLDRDDGRSIGEIALNCGYYDQAHLNRDFRELAGTTPTAYLHDRVQDESGIAA